MGKSVGTSITVATIDDSDFVCLVLKRLISVDAAISVVRSFSSASEASLFLADHRVDAVTLDMHLADADGPEIVRTIKTIGRCGVVVVSGNASEHPVALSHGATAAFDKMDLIDNHERFIAALHEAADHSRALKAAH